MKIRRNHKRRSDQPVPKKKKKVSDSANISSPKQTETSNSSLFFSNESKLVSPTLAPPKLQNTSSSEKPTNKSDLSEVSSPDESTAQSFPSPSTNNIETKESSSQIFLKFNSNTLYSANMDSPNFDCITKSDEFLQDLFLFDFDNWKVKKSPKNVLDAFEKAENDFQKLKELLGSYSLFIQGFVIEIFSRLGDLYPYECPVDTCKMIAVRFQSEWPGLQVYLNEYQEKYGSELGKKGEENIATLISKKLKNQFKTRADVLKKFGVWPWKNSLNKTNTPKNCSWLDLSKNNFDYNKHFSLLKDGQDKARKEEQKNKKATIADNS